MNSLHGVFPVGPQTWKGARLIRVDALPVALPTGLQSDILMRCQREHVSPELCLSTATNAPGEVAVFIILRTVSGYPYEALDRLERVNDMVLRRLTEANIRCHAVDIGADEARWPERFFSGDLMPISAAEGFFPPEGEQNPQGVYVPGQYGSNKAHPVNLGMLATLLSAYPNAMISLQMNATGFSASERQLIQENRAWFAARSNDPFMREGLEAFSRMEKVLGEPMFLACLTCFGSEACVRDVASQIRLCGLHSYRLPRIAAQDGTYVVRGNEWISMACIQYGHAPYMPAAMKTRMSRLTHMAPLGAMASAFTLPPRTGEIRGIRINRVPMSREPLPPSLTRTDGIYLGQDFDSGLSVFIQPKDLTRHGFFVGKPGSGKTTFALGLLYRLYSHADHYPFLAFEPAKTEYRSLMESIQDLRVYTPGRENVAPIQLNPFLPPKGVRLEQYQQDLEAIFAMAISVDHPLDVIFPQVVSRCYARYGWRSNSTRDSEGVRVFGIHEFIREFRRYIRDHYSGDPETLHNLENGGVVRLMALMKSPMFDTNRSLDVEQLLEHPTVIELDALNNVSHKALVMGIILTHIKETIQQRKSSGGKLRNLILIDEAHLLLGQSEEGEGTHPIQSVVEMLQEMTVIMRDYGTALMFGDQSPTRLTNVIMSNVELKLMFRLESSQDRAVLADATGLDREMVEAMPSMPAGEGFMSCSTLSRPIHILTPNVDKALNLKRDQPEERVRQKMQVVLKPPFSQCADCGCCGESCDPDVRAEGQFLAMQLVDNPEVVRCLSSEAHQRKLSAFMGEPLQKAIARLCEEFRLRAEDARLAGCAKAQFIRALLIHPQFTLTEKELMDSDVAREKTDRPEDDRGPGRLRHSQPVTDFQAYITHDNLLEMCLADQSSQPGEEPEEP